MGFASFQNLCHANTAMLMRMILIRAEKMLARLLLLQHVYQLVSNRLDKTKSYPQFRRTVSKPNDLCTGYPQEKPLYKRTVCITCE
jgi:hypothetical protein